MDISALVEAMKQERDKVLRDIQVKQAELADLQARKTALLAEYQALQDYIAWKQTH